MTRREERRELRHELTARQMEEQGAELLTELQHGHHERIAKHLEPFQTLK